MIRRGSETVVICVDFDGTCVTHDFPRIGKDIGAVPVLKELVENEHQLVLFTMRSGDSLDEAVQWFKDNDIELYGINVNPSQSKWTESPKAHGNIYIDDLALGAPLVYDTTTSSRMYINWDAVRVMLKSLGVI